jgi:hypothetical protein
MFRRIPTLLALLLLTSTVAARADVLLTMQHHTDAFEMMGQKQEARDSKIKTWIGTDRVRRDDEASSVILRLDQNKMYMVDHSTKTYSVLDLPIDFKKLMPEGGQQMMEQMSQMMKMDVTITPTEEKKTVGKWDTRKVKVGLSNSMGVKIDTTMWVSKSIGVDPAIYTKMTASLASLQPGSMDWVKKMEQIDGVPVLQESTVTMMGTSFKTREELLSVEDTAAAAASYDPPAGYTKKDFDPIAATAGR